MTREKLADPIEPNLRRGEAAPPCLSIIPLLILIDAFAPTP